VHLRPHVSAKTLGFHRAEDDRDLENPRGFRERNVVIDDRLAVKIGDAKEHLGLEVDQRDDAVVRGQQPFFAALRTSIALSHNVLLCILDCERYGLG
jgi:hypothetical protein